MNNISKLRDSADLLFHLGHIEEALNIYSEVNNLIWTSIGSINSAVSEFSLKNLSYDYRSSISFRNEFLSDVAQTTFLRSFSLDIDQTLNEFIFSTFGKLQCYCSPNSTLVLNSFDQFVILNEFYLLHILILNSSSYDWIKNVLKVGTPLLDNYSLKKIRYILPEENLSYKLISTAGKLNETDWAHLNFLLMIYLDLTENNYDDLYSALIHFNKLNSKFRYKNKYHHTKRNQNSDKSNKNYSYNHFEYDKKANKNDKEFDFNYKAFDPKNASDSEKQKYYGNVLGLKGKVSRSDIRKKYLETISLYHPDKVQYLGTDLIELAEKKAKEINMAYEYFKMKFDLP